ncbi:MAG: TonB-dependent receptor [Chlorobiaceae bacterium]
MKPLVMAAVGLGLFSPLGVHAEPITDLGSVGTQGGAGGGISSVAPAQASLQATQPQAIIDRSFFEDAKSPVADYTNIAAIAPSVSGGISANGPGLGEAKNTIRGFKDGEYNITFDDIPFGDTNGPTHHSTSYFPASIIDHITVERGPGNASNLGQATFGGSVNLYSLVPSSELSFSPFIALGSWNTNLVGGRFDSGSIAELGGSKLMVIAQEMSSDGYLTDSNVWNKNVTVKYEQPIGSHTLLTLFSSDESNYWYAMDSFNGLTASQAALYGKNYALQSTDPTKANYKAYNKANKTTAFDYIRLQSDLGCGWGIDNTSYYIWYGNDTIAADSSDPTSGLGTVYTGQGKSGALANQMPGYNKLNQYTIYGNIFKTTKQTDFGLFRVGFWSEWADTYRGRFDYNLLNMSPNYKETAYPGFASIPSNIQYDQGSGWNNYQPFAEFEWAATDNLKVTPGVKFMKTELFINAAVFSPKFREPMNLQKDYNATLPFLTANYKIDKNSSVYAQYAQGMLVPNIGNYYYGTAQVIDIKPQTSTNYQIGYVNKSDTIAFDADIYYIDFANKIAQDPTTSASNAVFYNQGGVVYKGIEAQVTYGVGSGFSLYANGSINSAKNKDTNLTINSAPESTAALALLYKASGWNSSLVYKYNGKQYADDTDLLTINPYTTLDCNIGYTINNPGLGAKKVKIDFGIYNILNRQDVISASMASASGPSAADLFTWQPSRSFMATLRVEY